MKRVLFGISGLLIGLLLAWLTVALFISVPPECGEPAACGDEYLFPALWFIVLFAVGFPTVALVLSRGSPRSYTAILTRLGLSALGCAVLLIVFSSVK